MTMLNTSLFTRLLATLRRAQMQRAYADSPESTPQGTEHPQWLASVQFYEPAKETIEDWEWAWIDLGGEG
jgi:hypothetical protein